MRDERLRGGERCTSPSLGARQAHALVTRRSRGGRAVVTPCHAVATWWSRCGHVAARQSRGHVVATSLSLGGRQGIVRVAAEGDAVVGVTEGGGGLRLPLVEGAATLSRLPIPSGVAASSLSCASRHGAILVHEPHAAPPSACHRVADLAKTLPPAAAPTSRRSRPNSASSSRTLHCASTTSAARPCWLSPATAEPAAGGERGAMAASAPRLSMPAAALDAARSPGAAPGGRHF